MSTRAAIVIVGIAALLAAGCALGPRSMPETHVDSVRSFWPTAVVALRWVVGAPRAATPTGAHAAASQDRVLVPDDGANAAEGAPPAYLPYAVAVRANDGTPRRPSHGMGSARC